VRLKRELIVALGIAIVGVMNGVVMVKELKKRNGRALLLMFLKMHNKYRQLQQLTELSG
jgi:hypothetical protein